MSTRPSQPVNRPVLISLCLLALTLVVALIAAATAHAAEYKQVDCAANSGLPAYTVTTNTTSPQNPAGIFTFENDCIDQGGDPPGDKSFVRISEHEAGGMAGYGAYMAVTFETPTGVNFRSAGGYLREPNAFNDGWQARFGFNYMNGSPQPQLVQGAHLEGSGPGYWGTTSIFGSYLWPWGYPIDFYRWTFEMVCASPSGCDRTNYNAVDLNGIVFTERDWEDSHASFTDTNSDLMAGRWVKGPQNVSWQASEKGSGIRMERLRLDGAERWSLDHGPECDTSSDQTNGTFARVYQPCPTGGPWGRSYGLDTASLPDGAHTVQVCAQDFAQWQGLNGTGGESCDQRTIRTDNTPPGAPANLEVRTADPKRYLSHFGAQWQLPPNQGSPIAKVHYDLIDATGKEVALEKTISASQPIELKDVEGPKAAGEYRLRVWLEDTVGFSGPAAIVAVPHDSTPPAAPQGLTVTPPTTPRSAEGFDVRWHDLADDGSPIDAVHYQVLDGTGKALVPTRTIVGEGIQSIASLDTPTGQGPYQLRVWLEDEEGNASTPATAPLAYECVRSDASGGTALSSGLGASGAAEEVVAQGSDSVLHGRLGGPDGGVGDAPLCIFSRVVTEGAREFLGFALTGPDGGYQFPIGAGPSRELSVLYRSGTREMASHATIETTVHPTFAVYRKVVHNKHSATFTGSIPGPDNDNVVVDLQVKRGKGWLAFRRYRTREDGQFTVAYKFNKTDVPTRYVMRAQVRAQGGYPYMEGDSDPLTLIVLPHASHRR